MSDKNDFSQTQGWKDFQQVHPLIEVDFAHNLAPKALVEGASYLLMEKYRTATETDDIVVDRVVFLGTEWDDGRKYYNFQMEPNGECYATEREILDEMKLLYRFRRCLSDYACK